MKPLAGVVIWAVASLASSQLITEGLAISVPTNARTPMPIDPIAHALARGGRLDPRPGDRLAGQSWSPIRAGADGWFDAAGRFVAVEVRLDRPEVKLLEASGHGMVYVNGEPRGGDVYAYGYVSLPVRLRAGVNTLLFSPGRGRLRVQLVDAPKPVSLDPRDALLPDLSTRLRPDFVPAAINVRNATGQRLEGLTLTARDASGREVSVKAPSVAPETTRKLRFAVDNRGTEKITVILRRRGAVLDRVDLTLRRREPNEAYMRTFVSEIDGSAQYYGVLPPPTGDPDQALFLTLHGAGVEAIGQAAVYSQKSWGWIVAPTNRRPFGFNWEDIGRLDALEVLEHARRDLRTDPTRTYLTGHSMGGHGTWHLGALYPDLWGAIAPSAGWISYWTYAGGATFPEGDAVGAMFRRAANASDTLALVSNLAQLPTYILHGDADDNVPVQESRTMRDALAPINPDLRWHEERGAGHWWDEPGPEPGTACVDWAPIFDLFAERRVPRLEERRFVDFVTFSPSVSARSGWAEIIQQSEQWRLSRVQLRADPHSRRVSGTTENVRTLQLDVRVLAPGPSATVELDGQAALRVPTNPSGRIVLIREDGSWRAADAYSLLEKHPWRSGGFKDVFRNRVAFVVGTGGSHEENAWARAAARYHAEMLAYIGNGSVDVFTDQVDSGQLQGRNVLLYGNARTNRLWDALIGADAPIRVEPGRLTLGEFQWAGEDLACLVIRPRVDELMTSVAAVSGTGVVGMRAAARAPLFTAGAAIPDVLAYGADALAEGHASVVATGFFGNDWGVSTGDFVTTPRRR